MKKNRAETPNCVGSGGVSPATAPREPPLRRRPETPCKGHAQGGAARASRRIGFDTGGGHTIGGQRLATVQWGGGAGEYDTCLSTYRSRGGRGLHARRNGCLTAHDRFVSGTTCGDRASCSCAARFSRSGPPPAGLGSEGPARPGARRDSHRAQIGHAGAAPHRHGSTLAHPSPPRPGLGRAGLCDRRRRPRSLERPTRSPLHAG